MSRFVKKKTVLNSPKNNFFFSKEDSSLYIYALLYFFVYPSPWLPSTWIMKFIFVRIYHHIYKSVYYKAAINPGGSTPTILYSPYSRACILFPFFYPSFLKNVNLSFFLYIFLNATYSTCSYWMLDDVDDNDDHIVVVVVY